MAERHDDDAAAGAQVEAIPQGSELGLGSSALTPSESQSTLQIRSPTTAQHLEAPLVATVPVSHEIDDSSAQLSSTSSVTTVADVATDHNDGAAYKMPVPAPVSIASRSAANVPDQSTLSQPDRIPRLSINPQVHHNVAIGGGGGGLKRSGSGAAIPMRTPSVKSLLSPCSTALDSPSPSSTLSSPSLGPMAEITPLPSPIVAGESPGLWGRKATSSDTTTMTETPSPTKDDSGQMSAGSPESRKPYGKLVPAINDSGVSLKPGHGRDRSISEYTSEPIHVARPRVTTVSGPAAAPEGIVETEPCMRREEYLAEARGITEEPKQLPTPPSSEKGRDGGDHDESIAPGQSYPVKPLFEYFEAVSLRDSTRHRWRSVRQLGTGAFSKVVLAVADDPQDQPDGTVDGAADGTGDVNEDAISIDEASVDPRQLVAIKIVEPGRAGSEDEKRIRSSLKRELELMQSLSHPCVVHLKAFSVEPSRALLVMDHAVGGDLFEFALHRSALFTPPLIRRILAELVTATMYLHEQSIVHRDIKLENILLNVRVDEIRKMENWQTYPYCVVTLSDLGLSRRFDPASPKLHTHCGSTDYAAPELIMAQPYDGRQTDAWSIGVVLYALMERRLPFDAPPGATEAQKSYTRKLHRIARCDFRWYKYADDDGEPGDFGELEPARHIVEGLLKRASRRLSLEQVRKDPWVKDAVLVDGGIRYYREQEV